MVGELFWFGATDDVELCSDLILYCYCERFDVLKFFGETCCHVVSGSALAYCSGESSIDVDGEANLICPPNILSRIKRIGACLQYGEM